MADPRAFALPFAEAIEFLRRKTRVPTETWTDVWHEGHARAFVVAGAMRDELLKDFQDELVRAAREGRTLEQFRAEFDDIVERHGWRFRGGRNWRSRVIFDTNLRSMNHAGRWAQIERLKEDRPWLRYVAVLDGRTRPEHEAWHDTVLPADDPWWDTHYPPNGWYCRCTVQALSERDLDRMGLQPSPAAPPSPVVTRTVRDARGPRAVEVPEGIDPGFAYNVGKAAAARSPVRP